MAKLNEIFSQANRVTRRDKALILGFMGGCRENPMPSPENYIVIKLGESEVRTHTNLFFKTVFKMFPTFPQIRWTMGEYCNRLKIEIVQKHHKSVL